MVKAASLEGPCFPPEFASWWGCCGHFNPMKIKKENCPFCEPRPQTSIPSTSHATDTGIVLDVGSAQLLGGSSGQGPWSSSSPYPMAWGKGCVCWLGSSELGQRQAMEVWAWEVPTLPRREAALVTCPVLLLSQISLTRWKKKITALQRGQGLGGARGEGRWESCCQLVGWLGVAWGRGRCRNLENSSSIWGLVGMSCSPHVPPEQQGGRASAPAPVRAPRVTSRAAGSGLMLCTPKALSGSRRQLWLGKAPWCHRNETQCWRGKITWAT